MRSMMHAYCIFHSLFISLVAELFPLPNISFKLQHVDHQVYCYCYLFNDCCDECTFVEVNCYPLRHIHTNLENHESRYVFIVSSSFVGKMCLTLPLSGSTFAPSTL